MNKNFQASAEKSETHWQKFHWIEEKRALYTYKIKYYIPPFIALHL